MLFLRFDGKEIPYERAWENPDYIAFMQRIQAARELAEKKRNERITIIVGLVGLIIAVAAAGAAFWSGYEAHQTRIEDERPYIRTEFAGFSPESAHDLNTPNDKTIENASFTPHVKLNVFGKSPAIEVIALSSCEYSNGTATETESDIQGLGFIFPAEDRTIPCKPARKPFTAVKVSGAVSYTDVHGKEYKTPYCFKAKFGNVDHSEPCPANNVM